MEKAKRISDSTHRTSSSARILILILTIALGVSLFWNWASTPEKTVSMSPFIFIDNVEGYVTAQGSWLSSDSKLSTPLQTANVDCWKDIGYCIVFIAELNSDKLLLGTTEYYQISHWTDYMITTMPLEYGCVTYQLTIDRHSQTVTNVRTKNSGATGSCSMFDKAPIRLSLGDGWKRIEQNRVR
jgi:hypothetical protein